RGRWASRRRVLHGRAGLPGSDGGRHVPLDPRAEQRQPRHPRQAPDRVVDLPRRRLTLRAAEQRRGEETELVRGLHAGADRSPESLHEEPRDAGDARLGETALRLLVVEEEMAALAPDSARERATQAPDPPA